MGEGFHIPGGTLIPDGNGDGGGCISSIFAIGVFLLLVSWGIDSCSDAIFGEKEYKVVSQDNSNDLNNYPAPDYNYEYPQNEISLPPNSVSVRNSLSPEIALYYYYQINNCDTSKLVEEFLIRFDENYNDYLRDEFIIREKIISTREIIREQIKNNVLEKIFDTVFKVQFTRYDFKKKGFNFINFPIDYDYSNIINDWCCNPSFPKLSIIFTNLSEFNRDLLVDESNAKKLVSQKTNTDSENERTLYLKIFYSFLNHPFAITEFNNAIIERILLAKISKIEVWTDKQTTNWKIAEFIPKDTSNIEVESSVINSEDSLDSEGFEKNKDSVISYTIYEVRQNETLSNVLRRHPQLNFQSLLKYNPEIVNGIHFGQKLKIAMRSLEKE